MERLVSFDQDSSRYAILIDPTIQLTHLSQPDIADLTVCLDYSRLSTTPRRKSSSGPDPRPLVSNLPSPFFDDFLNLLPLNGNFSFKDAGGDIEPGSNVGGNGLQLRESDSESGVFRTYIRTPDTSLSSRGDFAVAADDAPIGSREHEATTSRTANLVQNSGRRASSINGGNGHHTFTVNPLQTTTMNPEHQVNMPSYHSNQAPSSFNYTPRHNTATSPTRLTSSPLHLHNSQSSAIQTATNPYAYWQAQPNTSSYVPKPTTTTSNNASFFDPFASISPSPPATQPSSYARKRDSLEQQQQSQSDHAVAARRLSTGVGRRPWYAQGTAIVGAGN